MDLSEPMLKLFKKNLKILIISVLYKQMLNTIILKKVLLILYFQGLV